MLDFLREHDSSAIFSASHMAKQFFGTDGIRGVPGTPPLDDATLYAVGRALGAYLHQEHPPHVLIGMDTRESGPHIAAILAAGLHESAVDVTLCRRPDHARRRLPGPPE